MAIHLVIHDCVIGFSTDSQLRGCPTPSVLRKRSYHLLGDVTVFILTIGNHVKVALACVLIIIIILLLYVSFWCLLY